MIDGVVIRDLTVHADARGRFIETFRKEWVAGGREMIQANRADRQAGCIVGLHEVLRRQGLMRGVWTLDPRARLTPDQQSEIDRVLRRYPELTDDDFVSEHREEWLR